jgi:hypothetical protein
MSHPRAVTIPVQLHRRSERRAEERFVAAMPVQVDGAGATTQDLSSSGLSFLSDRPYELGTRVDVVIEYLLDGHNYPLECKAEVVRVESVAQGWRIGAKLAPESRQVDVSLPAAGV